MRVLPTAKDFRLRIPYGLNDVWKKQCFWWCAVCGGQYSWRDPHRILVTHSRLERFLVLCFCGQIHLPHDTFSHAQSLHSTDDMCAWLKGTRLKTNCVPKTFTHPRAMFHFTPHSTLNTSTSSLSLISHVLLSSSSPNPDLLSTHPFIHCEDPRQDGTSTEFHSTTGCEPKRIELNRILANPQNQIIDDQDDTEESGVKPLSYSQSLIHSAYDSAETHCDATRLGPRRRTIT